jgi:hypothetical protein
MKFVWSKTGDYIEFDSFNNNFLELVIDEWNKSSINKFTFDKKLDVILEKDNLDKNLNLVNNFLKKLNVLPFVYKFDDLNQDSLNLLHKEWVLFHINNSAISMLLNKNKILKDAFSDINISIHRLESIFSITLNNNSVISVRNPYKESITTFNQTNLYFHNSNLGRSSYSKWKNNDKSIHGLDRNDMSEVYGIIEFNLHVPHTVLPPIEYQNWCKENKIECAGNKISIGNFKNLQDNLTIYRNLFVKNFNIDDNYCFLEI